MRSAKLVIPILLFVMPSPLLALDTTQVCQDSTVLNLVTESVVEMLEVIELVAVDYRALKVTEAPGTYEEVHCKGTMVYSLFAEKQVALNVEYLVQEDIDNIYVTLMSLDL